MGNTMMDINIEKLTLNVGAGKDHDKLEKGVKLIEYLTGITPVKTKSNKRIPGWGVRPGLPIGCKVTIRGKKKKELIKKFVEAKDNLLKPSQFDNNGNVSFGVHEYINIPGIKYHPEIGIMGFQIAITLSKPGKRVANRRLGKRKVPMKQRVSREEAIDFMKKEFNVELDE
ncbi:MAG: 50S ribosomal protein L5 [Nanoarchaeota archaeon]